MVTQEKKTLNFTMADWKSSADWKSKKNYDAWGIISYTQKLKTAILMMLWTFLKGQFKLTKSSDNSFPQQGTLFCWQLMDYAPWDNKGMWLK